MRSSAFLYPWDVLGDPAAPARLRDLGVDGVTLASAYHSARALTPRHPATRIVTAPHSAVYYPAASARWSGHDLRPYQQEWLPGDDPWGEAAQALRDVGLEVSSWVVLAHNSRLGDDFPASSVCNAYGDRYPWALCAARPEVVRYCTELAAEAGARPGAVAAELESCGWYGLAHLHAHDKTGGVQLDGAAQYLMSLCFCDVCSAAWADAGAPDLDAAVRSALEPVWRGGGTPAGGPAGSPAGGQGSGQGSAGAGGYADRAEEWAAVEQLLGADLARLTLDHRAARALELQRGCVSAVRAAAGEGFRVYLHADPAVHRVGANVGVDVARLGRGPAAPDGLVLPCTGPDGLGNALPELAAAWPGGRLAANLTVVSGLGGDPALPATAPPAADELRLYHAGLASDPDLVVLRQALAGAAGR
ncbi:hypothetical protein GXW83_25570 [Streptacidiphilus sp. PB12-B1b]|uniref:hypothetical protein n=1 Tax=Streptacidiphilus sp. PB12-B1b TaxID=2705012 RepID=UPI0015FE6ECD|nr:hypothetical protein [Streptacidiphilus sp. PB12-B1b]QMU78574.1 hypothetical protein GXW83_25570 [Streptacidiphilus sp. PB12-B1b]